MTFGNADVALLRLDIVHSIVSHAAKLAVDMRIPAKSTVHAVLDHHRLVKRTGQRCRMKVEGTRLSVGLHSNALCCCDYKGEFRTGNGRTCCR